MGQYNTETSLNALYKEVYADGVANLIPENIKLLKMVPFKETDSPGDKFIQPVMLAHEHGFSVGTGAYALNNSIAAVSAEAQVDGYQMLLRTAIGYDAADRMAGSKKSFVKWGDQLFMNMLNSISKRLEVLQMYGRTGLGTVSANAAGVLTITTASWAPGIWAGAVGMELEAYTATTGGTQHNGTLTVTAVDLDARTVTVTGTNAAVVANDILYYKGFYGAEQYGLDSIITNTGNLYNISAATYELWKGSSYAAGGALTAAKVLSAAAKVAERGCEEDLTFICSPKTWANLNSDQAALRAYDSSYGKKADQGFEEIAYHGQNGLIKVVSSIYCKEGESFMFPVKRCKRIGSTDITFNRPGQSEKVFLELPSNAGFELRARSSQTLFCERPAYCTKITGIVNS
jgi:hypothetical protein